MKKTNTTNWALQLTSLLLSAILIEVGAIYVGFKTSDAFSGNCGDTHPSALPTLIIALIGIALALRGIISAFKKKHYWGGAVAIVLGLICAIMGLYAVFVAAFQLCF